MSDRSSIEWCDATWNPITGCSPVSAGCDHCYAKRMAERFGGPFGKFYPPRFIHGKLDEPLRWKKPRRIFVGSMTDLFHPDVEETWLRQVFRTMGLAPRHTFMILTKRPERMKAVMQALWNWSWPHSAGFVPVDKDGDDHPLPNVYLGVTAENQEMADQRIPILLQTPAAKRFVSVEPMLGPVDLRRVKIAHGVVECAGGRLPPIDWVICGGESGPGARPMHPDWPRSLRDQCQAAGVPFFFKQWGEWSPEKPSGFHKVSQKRYSHEADTFTPDGARYRADHPDDYQLLDMVTMWRVGKKAAGCLLDGREWKEFPVR